MILFQRALWAKMTSETIFVCNRNDRHFLEYVTFPIRKLNVLLATATAGAAAVVAAAAVAVAAAAAAVAAAHALQNWRRVSLT